jgi:hypothetical protein
MLSEGKDVSGCEFGEGFGPSLHLSHLLLMQNGLTEDIKLLLL